MIEASWAILKRVIIRIQLSRRGWFTRSRCWDIRINYLIPNIFLTQRAISCAFLALTCLVLAHICSVRGHHHIVLRISISLGRLRLWLLSTTVCAFVCHWNCRWITFGHVVKVIRSWCRLVRSKLLLWSGCFDMAFDELFISLDLFYFLLQSFGKTSFLFLKRKNNVLFLFHLIWELML